MKTYHAAVLAMVGWYLMSAGGNPKVSPLLSSWTIMGSFDTAEQCEAKRFADIDKAGQDLKARHRDKIPLSELNSHDDSWAITLLNEACIASDDPRLKG